MNNLNATGTAVPGTEAKSATASTPGRKKEKPEHYAGDWKLITDEKKGDCRLITEGMTIGNDSIIRTIVMDGKVVSSVSSVVAIGLRPTEQVDPKTNEKRFVLSRGTVGRMG